MRLAGLLLAAAFLHLPPVQSVRAADAGEMPLELRPYPVRMQIGFDAPQLSVSSRAELLEQIRHVAQRCVGVQWDLTVEDAADLQPVSADGLARLTPPDANPGDVTRMVAAVRFDGARWRVDVRVYQTATGFSETIGAEAHDRRDIPLLVLQLCSAAFRPVGVVEDVDGKVARVVMQAGALAVPDESFAFARTARWFVPVLSSRKRDGTIDRLQPIPWTFLTAVKSEQGRVTCDLQSGLRSAIGGKQRGRVQTLAVAIHAAHRSTQLELATQSDPSLPLVAHRLELRNSPEIPVADEVRESDEHLIAVLLTDRRGRVTLAADSADSVIWLFAYSGRHLLARVPILPGMASELRLEVPDDSARLAAESDLSMLQGQLIEAVAERNAVIARVRAAIKKNDATAANAAAGQLRSLPDVQFYLDRVTEIRVPSVKAAKARKDRAGEVRINRMCDELAELIRQYLGADKRKLVLEELKELALDDVPDKPAENR